MDAKLSVGHGSAAMLRCWQISHCHLSGSGAKTPKAGKEKGGGGGAWGGRNVQDDCHSRILLTCVVVAHIVIAGVHQPSVVVARVLVARIKVATIVVAHIAKASVLIAHILVAAVLVASICVS